MSDLKNIVGQSSVILLGTAVTVLSGFFFKAFLARHLGAGGLGIYSLGISVVTIASIFVTLGLGNGLVRFVSKYMAEQNYVQLHTYLYHTFKLSLISTCLFGSMLVLFPHFIATRILHAPEMESYLWFFAILLLLNSFVALFDQIIRGCKQVKKSTVIGNFIRQPFKIILAVVLMLGGSGLSGYLVAEIAAALLTVLLFALLARKLLSVMVRPIFKAAQSKLLPEERKFGMNFLLINLTGVLQTEGDKILLAAYFSTTELGIYAVILTFLAFVPIVLKAVIAIFGPIASEQFSLGNFSALKNLLMKTTYFTFLISFSIAFIIAYSGQTLLLIFGREYQSGYVPMLIILSGSLLDVVTGSIGTVLVMSGNERYVRNISIYGFIGSIILFLIFIPVWGIYGAAVVKMFVLLCTNGYVSVVLYKTLNMSIFNKSYMALLLYSALFLVLGYFLREELTATIVTTIWSCAGLLLAYYIGWYLLLADPEHKRYVGILISKFRAFTTSKNNEP